MSNDKINLLQNIIYEARAYNSFEDIEKLVEYGSDLSMVPVQPLYVSLLTSSADQVAVILPKLSKNQRQCLLDLDLWKRDVVDVNSFEFWIEVYSKCKEVRVVEEFVRSEDFLLYLKARINLYTFDVEDPQYPDHDDYFLTDDNLLLIELGEEYKYSDEIKYLIRVLYSLLGVENAYSVLFKLVNDSFSILQEDEFYAKKERLRDFGFVDYFEAREKLFPFANVNQINKFIENKKTVTGSINLTSQNQSLHASALVSFDSEMENIIAELNKVKDEFRQTFLHFTFIRLINSTITLNDALRGGRIELTKIGKQTKAMLELGLQYIHRQREFKDESIFMAFDFFDVYKIGKTLIDLEQTKIKKALKNTPFEQDEFEYFLGTWWSSFLNNSFEDIPKTKTFGAGLHAKDIDDLATYLFWQKDVELFVHLVPFVNQFHQTILKLKQDGLLNDSFYLNYEVDNIDFESVLISSYINFSLGHYASTDVNKMGLSINEFMHFLNAFFAKNEAEFVILPLDDKKMRENLNQFTTHFGFDVVPEFSTYLHGILTEHLSGYEYETLNDEDFKHVGGPILLANSTKN